MAIPGISSEADPELNITAEEGKYLVLNMTGHERLGQMYEYMVELAAKEKDLLDLLAKPIDLGKLIGTGATLTMKIGTDKRHFHGYVTRAMRGEKRGRYDTYTIALQPGLWFLTRTKTSRIFQKASVKDVVTEVLDDYKKITVKWDLVDPSVYPKLDYCVQHDETDFDFVSRLLEEVGIYYYFTHDDGSHTTVFVDATAKHEKRKGDGAIPWGTKMENENTITTWHTQQEVRGAKAIVSEYDYLAPATKTEAFEDAEKKPAMLGKMEWFEHPTKVIQNSVLPDGQDADNSKAAKQRAKVRMEELLSCYSFATGQTNARDIGTGVTFEIEKTLQKADEGAYLVVSAVYHLDFGDHEAVDDLQKGGAGEGFLCDFLCISKDGPSYRSPRITPRPVIAGPQTALVVGPKDNEIHTDKHGRIKVQFHWDRIAKEKDKKQDSSCWVRVARPWAGKGYGAFSLPRVGEEVVVQFLNGDPDRPLVTGAVYNNVNMMAWQLPDQALASGVKTQSSKEGTPALANELRFYDEKGKEYIWFHAEKDFRRMVENDSFDWVGHNESVRVVMTRKEMIGENWFMDITKDVMHNIGKDLHVNVKGDMFYTGGATFQVTLEKDLNAKIGGKLGLTVLDATHLKSTQDIAVESEKGGISFKAAAAIVIESKAGITLKVGGSVVVLSSGAVDIVGQAVNVNSGGSGGSATSAQPGEATKAKTEPSIMADKEKDYSKTFDDPMPKEMGGTGEAKAAAAQG